MPCLICFYNVSLKLFWDYSEMLLALHFEEDYSKGQHHVLSVPYMYLLEFLELSKILCSIHKRCRV